MTLKQNNKFKLLILIQILYWLIVFCSPLFFLQKNVEGYIDWEEYIAHLSVPIALLLLFYLNYILLIPKFINSYINQDRATNKLHEKKNIIFFICINIVAIAILSCGMYYWENTLFPNKFVKDHKNIELVENQKRGNDNIQARKQMPAPHVFDTTQCSCNQHNHYIKGNNNNDTVNIHKKNHNEAIGNNVAPPQGGNSHNPSFDKNDYMQKKDQHLFPYQTTRNIENILVLLLCIVISLTLKISENYSNVQNALREAEKNKTEAELNNLRNQLNPHFLLNTLNNIYALIQFDTEKAQKAVQDLSKLLQYVLYDNQQNYVSLNKEIDFIKNYIELMKIRLNDNVVVKEEFNVSSESYTQVAPLLFISLIENSFKHGISPDEKSYINIHIDEDEKNHKIRCLISNSYYPKNDTDKSGSGVGLEQVRRRLELMYKGKYSWTQYITDDNKKYVSLLEIETK